MDYVLFMRKQIAFMQKSGILSHIFPKSWIQELENINAKQVHVQCVRFNFAMMKLFQYICHISLEKCYFVNTDKGQG